MLDSTSRLRRVLLCVIVGASVACCLKRNKAESARRRMRLKNVSGATRSEALPCNAVQRFEMKMKMRSRIH